MRRLRLNKEFFTDSPAIFIACLLIGNITTSRASITPKPSAMNLNHGNIVRRRICTYVYVKSFQNKLSCSYIEYVYIEIKSGFT